MELLKEGGLIQIPKGSASDGRDIPAATIWGPHVRIENVQTAQRRFHFRVLTDGCSVSVIMSHPTSLADPKAPAELPDVTLKTSPRTRVVTVDPGITDVVATFTKIFDGGRSTHGEVRSFSSMKYYERAMIHRSNRRTRKYNKETATISSSILSANVATVEGLGAHLRSLLAVHRELLDHRFRRGYRNLRFFRYTRRQRAIREICEFIAPSPATTSEPVLRTVVGFGNWNPGSDCAISRRASGPLQDIRWMLSSRKDVTLVPLDEFRSSSRCSCCHAEVVNKKDYTFRRWTGSRSLRRQKIHKVVHCRGGDFLKHQSTGLPTTWDRDENAARNLHVLLLHKLRGEDPPIVFRRRT